MLKIEDLQPAPRGTAAHGRRTRVLAVALPTATDLQLGALAAETGITRSALAAQLLARAIGEAA